jgi:hypothetical protein
VPALGVYFYSYDQFKKIYRLTTYIPSEEMSNSQEFRMKLLCGGLSGTICWIVAFPLDVIKT